jgi:hypothetical protein
MQHEELNTRFVIRAPIFLIGRKEVVLTDGQIG